MTRTLGGLAGFGNPDGWRPIRRVCQSTERLRVVASPWHRGAGARLVALVRGDQASSGRLITATRACSEPWGVTQKSAPPRISAKCEAGGLHAVRPNLPTRGTSQGRQARSRPLARSRRIHPPTPGRPRTTRSRRPSRHPFA